MSARLLQAPAGWLARLRARLASRPDTEHEQALIRIGFALFIAGFIAVAAPSHPAPWTFFAWGMAISGTALVLSIAILAHILVRPATNVPRRFIGMFVDTAGVTSVMMVGGMTAAPFYPLLLWIIFGHGFRFGRTYLFASATSAVLLFALVMLVNPDWRAVPVLDVALLLALIVLPAYVSILLRKLEAAIQRAEEANQAKSRFLAIMSHEFRTPLNAVIGLSELLGRDERHEDRREMLGTIRTAAGALLGLVDAVLDVAKIESGKFAIVEQPFDLHGVLGILRGLLEPQARARGLFLRLRLDPGIQPLLQGDPGALRQVLTNLIANALKFTERGGVTMRIDAAPAADGRVGIRFAVSDTGIGIPAEVQARIFESFTQADDGTSRAYGGTGLGLTIARELVDLMGDELTVSSEPGKGSTFTFTLAFAPAAPQSVPPLPVQGTVVVLGDGELASRVHQVARGAGFASQAAAELGTATVLLKRGHGRRVLILADSALSGDLTEMVEIILRRIDGPVDVMTVGDEATRMPQLEMAHLPPGRLEGDLPILLRAALAPHEAKLVTSPESVIAKHPARLLIAEDNLTNQQVARRILESAGHQVVIVGSGHEAMERLEEESFDLVLMDLNMPGISGIETVKLLRFAHDTDELPPIIALTADVTDETITECRKVGFSDYAEKPINAALLVGMIDRHLADRNVTPPVSAPIRIVPPPRPAAPQAPPPAPTLTAPAPPAPPARGNLVALPQTQDGRPVIEHRKLEGLALLDQGDGFLEEVLETFMADAVVLVGEIDQAVQAGDAALIRDRAHALRSSAAHVGASALFDVLLGWRGLDDTTLLRQGPAEAQRLRLEMERANEALRQWQRDRAPARSNANVH